VGARPFSFRQCPKSSKTGTRCNISPEDGKKPETWLDAPQRRPPHAPRLQPTDRRASCWNRIRQSAPERADRRIVGSFGCTCVRVWFVYGQSTRYVSHLYISSALLCAFVSRLCSDVLRLCALVFHCVSPCCRVLSRMSASLCVLPTDSSTSASGSITILFVKL